MALRRPGIALLRPEFASAIIVSESNTIVSPKRLPITTVINFSLPIHQHRLRYKFRRAHLNVQFLSSAGLVAVPRKAASSSLRDPIRERSIVLPRQGNELEKLYFVCRPTSYALQFLSYP